MKLRWMPLDVADYRADTAHLGALEHGVYLLLIMHYWQTGSLPDDDEKLARICCCTRAEFRRVKPTVAAFFLPGWKHKRIEQEIVKAKDISGKRRGAALSMHEERRSSVDANAHASAEQQLTPIPSPLPSQRKIDSSLGEAKCEARSPPRHGITSQQHGRIYVRKGTPEWEAYAEDYRAARGEEPPTNADGGKWFKTLGEPRNIDRQRA